MFRLPHLHSLFRLFRRSSPRRKESRSLLLVEELERREVPTTLPLQLDMGTGHSPVETGYTEVSVVAYTPVRGFGWESLHGLRAKNRPGGDALTGDFHYSKSEGTFLVDLPDGTYDVTVRLGDLNRSFDSVSLLAEDRLMRSGLQASAGQFLTEILQVTVNDGQLNLRIVDTGGADQYFAINGLEIAAGAADQIITIDTAWLQARGPGPYILDQADTTYVLATDVQTEESAFVVAAAGVTLDLNGHTVTYGNSIPVSVVNGGFEFGSGTSVPGWDLSGAPTATIVPNDGFLFGDQVLRLGPSGTMQTIVSDAISIPQAGHTYTATITPDTPNLTGGFTVTLKVFDAVTDLELGSGAGSTSRGASAVVHFTPSSTNPVYLRIEVTSSGGTYLDLDEATLTVSHDYGIFAADNEEVIPGLANLPPAAQAVYTNANHFTIKNGKVFQGQGNGYGSSALFFKGLDGITVENVETFVTGMDTVTLDANSADEYATIRNSIFGHGIDNISDRMRVYGTIWLTAVDGPILVEGNQLLDSPQVGINVAGSDPQYTVTIRNNEFRPNTVVTNGYAIRLSEVQNFEIVGNTILVEDGKSGRGILLEAPGEGGMLAHGEIHGNYVDVQQRPEREFDLAGPVHGLRMRTEQDGSDPDDIPGGPHQDIHIHDNTIIARTDDVDGVREAYAVRLTFANDKGQMNNAGIVLENNTFMAVADTTDTDYTARALYLDRIDTHINLRIANNVLESNDLSLAVAGSTGSVYDVDLISNTFRKSDEGAVRDYHAVRAGEWTRVVSDVRIIDPRLENGATLDKDSIDWGGPTSTGLKDLSIGWLVDVVVEDSTPEGFPVEGATVSITDKDNNQVYVGMTGSGGRIEDIIVVATVYRQETSDSSLITQDNRGPFLVSATLGTLNDSESVSLTGNLEVTLTI